MLLIKYLKVSLEFVSVVILRQYLMYFLLAWLSKNSEEHVSLIESPINLQVSPKLL